MDKPNAFQEKLTERAAKRRARLDEGIEERKSTRVERERVRVAAYTAAQEEALPGLEDLEPEDRKLIHQERRDGKSIKEIKKDWDLSGAQLKLILEGPPSSSSKEEKAPSLPGTPVPKPKSRTVDTGSSQKDAPAPLWGTYVPSPQKWWEAQPLPEGVYPSVLVYGQYVKWCAENEETPQKSGKFYQYQPPGVTRKYRCPGPLNLVDPVLRKKDKIRCWIVA